jgi:hypothetical protein
LPGKPDAPILFRKAAAVLVTQDDPELLFAISRIFSLGKLVGAAKEASLNVAKIIDNATVTNEDTSLPTREQFEDNATSRITSFFSFIQDKARKGPPIKLSSVISHVKKTIKEAAGRWGSASPMSAVKAVDRGLKLLTSRKDEHLDLNLDDVLTESGVLDLILQQDRQHLQPESRVRLYVRGHKSRPSPVTASVVGSLAATLAQTQLLDAKDTMELGPDRGAPTNSESPSYTFRDKHAEWQAMKRCRTLMHTASSAEDLQTKLSNLTLKSDEEVCRDEAGRFVRKCNPSELRQQDADKLRLKSSDPELVPARELSPKSRPSQSTYRDKFSHLPTRRERRAARENRARVQKNPFLSDSDTTGDEDSHDGGVKSRGRN